MNLSEYFYGVAKGWFATHFRDLYIAWTPERVESLADLLRQSQVPWIRVEDRKPEQRSALEMGDKVLTYGIDGFRIAKYDDIYGGNWYECAEWRTLYGVTHWMPLPPAPGSAENLPPAPPVG